jgi:hypothetical protein
MLWHEPQQDMNERSEQLMFLELRLDDWRTIYDCKRIPRSAIVRVFETIGWPTNPLGMMEAPVLESFFTELKRQRPDLFQKFSASENS